MTEPGQRKHKPGKRHCDERINWPAVCKTGLLTERPTCSQNDRRSKQQQLLLIRGRRPFVYCLHLR